MNGTEAPEMLPQPMPLIVAYAPRRERAWHRLCLEIDERMGRTVLHAKEGAAAAIRLAWWEEALTGTDRAPGGEPLLQQWRASDPGAGAADAVQAVAAAWRMLLDPTPMSELDWRGFGAGRAALFTLVERGGSHVAPAGAAVWALWDVARRDPDRVRAEGAFAAAIEASLADRSPPPPPRSKALRLAVAMATDDVEARHIPDERFTARQYLRLVRRSLIG